MSTKNISLYITLCTISRLGVIASARRWLSIEPLEIQHHAIFSLLSVSRVRQTFEQGQLEATALKRTTDILQSLFAHMVYITVVKIDRDQISFSKF